MGGRRGLAVRWLLLFAAALPWDRAVAASTVSLSVIGAQAQPGGQVVLPLVLAGDAQPGIVALSIRLRYASGWLSFVGFREGDLIIRSGLMGAYNAVTEGDSQLVALSLAGAAPLAGAGELGDLIFQVSPDAPPGAAVRLGFASGTQANRGLPGLAMHAGLVGLRRVPRSGDFDGDRRVSMADFFAFADFFGTQVGGCDYLFDCDLDADGVVGFEDFFLFADLFGTVY